MEKLTDQQIVSRFKLKSTDKIVDIGGSMRQHEQLNIDTLVDLIRPEDAPYEKSILKAKKFVGCDFTKQKLPFRDKQFDFCLCTHTIEDLSSPFLLLDEMSRIAKRGYISTPSMGIDMVFSNIDYTDWLTGSKRVPGHGHHKWFVVKQKHKLVLIPKNYPLLYTSHFQFSKWSGESETQYYWEDKIDYKEIKDIKTQTIIDYYQKYIDDNKSKLNKSTVLVYLDSPFHYLKALAKLIFKRGDGFKYRNK